MMNNSNYNFKNEILKICKQLLLKAKNQNLLIKRIKIKPILINIKLINPMKLK